MPITRSGSLFAFGILFAAALCSPLRADDKPADNTAKLEKSQFIRIVRDELKRPLTMETAIVRYVPTDEKKPGPIVDLIAAVHVGEKKYYEQLNQEFANYDSLLYELVAPKGTKVPKKAGATGSPVSALQIWMKNTLNLEFQLEQIDYHASNFVHADMSPEDFSKSMKNLNESPVSMFLKLMQASMAQQNQKPVNNMLMMAALFDRKEGPLVLKQIMADQLDGADTMLEALNGPEGSTLVTERNKFALKVLGEEATQGKKRLAIFYGAAHMTDMEKRLLEQLPLKRTETRWLAAWDLKAPAKTPAAPDVEKKSESK